MLIFSKSDFFTCSCLSVWVYVMFQLSEISSISQKCKLSHGINYLLRFRVSPLTKGDMMIWRKSLQYQRSQIRDQLACSTLSSVYFHVVMLIAKSKLSVVYWTPASVVIQSEILGLTCRPSYSLLSHHREEIDIQPLGWKQKKCGFPPALQTNAPKPGNQAGLGSGNASEL